MDYRSFLTQNHEKTKFSHPLTKAFLSGLFPNFHIFSPLFSPFGLLFSRFSLVFPRFSPFFPVFPRCSPFFPVFPRFSPFFPRFASPTSPPRFASPRLRPPHLVAQRRGGPPGVGPHVTPELGGQELRGGAR